MFARNLTALISQMIIKNLGGCQKFAVALHCPLVKELPDQLSTEYALYTVQYNPALKNSLKDFLASDADYENDLKLKERFNLKYPKSKV